MPDPRVDEEFLLGDVAYRPPDGQGHNGDIGPVLVLGKENSGTGRRDVLPPLDVDSVNGMETGMDDSPDKLIE